MVPIVTDTLLPFLFCIHASYLCNEPMSQVSKSTRHKWECSPFKKVVRHCQGPVIQGQLPQEDTQHASGWCNAMPASAATGSPCIPYTSLSKAWVSQRHRIAAPLTPSCLSEKHNALRRPTHRSGAKSKAEPWELCEQRRERKISPSSFRSSGLNFHNQLDVRCICGIPE